MRTLKTSYKSVVFNIQDIARCRIALSKSGGNALCTRA